MFPLLGLCAQPPYCFISAPVRNISVYTQGFIKPVLMAMLIITGTKMWACFSLLPPPLNLQHSSLMQIKVNVCATAGARMRSHQLDFVDVNGLCCHESSIKCVFVQLTQTLFPLQINLEAPLPESSFLENKK